MKEIPKKEVLDNWRKQVQSNRALAASIRKYDPYSPISTQAAIDLEIQASELERQIARFISKRTKYTFFV